MAHLKLDLLLKETGFKPTKNQRTRVYLTNSLEEHHPDTGTLFANWLSREANDANHIKRDTPVMCVIGNPPYSGESANKGEWIMQLMEDYKKEPGGKEKLKERNPKWINDDYVKFLRYGQHYIEKNGSGVLAFINPHGFLDNPTFRGMRWHLLKTYDKIYTIDLHGNSKKKETAPDGSVDENVFDIQQGVSINVLVKTGKKKANELGKVFHFDLYGRREMKYDFLLKNSLRTIDFVELANAAPKYLFIQQDLKLKSNYKKGFYLKDFFNISGNGIVSKRDPIAYKESKQDIKEVIQSIYHLSTDEIKQKFQNVSWKSRDGKVEFVKQNITKFGLNENLFVECDYRPFDKKWTYYNGQSKGFIGWPVYQIMTHFLNRDNLSLNLIRRSRKNEFVTPFLTTHIVDKGILSTLDNSNIFPLYIYPETTDQQTLDNSTERKPNLNNDILNKIEERMGLKFVSEIAAEGDVCMANSTKVGEYNKETFAPIQLLDYIYAILHSPTYREKYKDFLKIDFPRVPYPEDQQTFWHLVELGSQLRQLHLLESHLTEEYITTYPKDGSNEVTTKIGKNDWELFDTEKQLGRIWINDDQYFDNISLIAWEFYIGGYKPAQKWLKDRKGKTLGYEDILHYQKIIVALTETSMIMKKIDEIEIV